MSLSLTEIKAELEAMMHGTSLSQVQNIFGVFNRAARQVLLDIDPSETKRTAKLGLVYYQVYDYALPSDLKGNKIIDLIPVQNGGIRPVVYQTYNQNFDINKNQSLINDFTIYQDSGVKFGKINFNNKSQTVVLNTASQITGEGTWATSGTASNLAVNYQITNGTIPSLGVDISTGVGIITNSTFNDQDLTTHYNQGANIFTLYLPDASLITSVSLKIGSSASNYYLGTMTTRFDGTSFKSGFNTLGITLDNMSTVGSPDISKINYIQLSITVSAPVYSVCFYGFTNSLGTLFNVNYYSKYLFQDVSGNWKEKATLNGDKINLDTESYNIFLYQAAFLCVQQALGQDAAYDTNLFLDKYNESIARYKRMYKSEIQKPQIPYYTRTNVNYNSMLGRTY